MNRNRRVLNGASCGTMAVMSFDDLTTRDVDFAYVLVRDDPLEAVPGLIAQVLDCAHDSGGDVVSCVFAAFGLVGAARLFQGRSTDSLRMHLSGLWFTDDDDERERRGE